MKKLSIIILLFSTISVLFFSCKDEDYIRTDEKTTIVLVNPSLGYLKSFEYLVDNKIIDLPEINIQVIHYAGTKNAFSTIDSYIQQHNLDYIHQSIIQGNLEPENLFRTNELSASYRQIFEDADAILFLGGADFPAKIYNQKTNLLTKIETPHRHYFELSFLFHLFGGSQDPAFKPLLEENPDFVIFGFCLGMQSMNVAAGGDMYQDIPSEIYGCQYVEDVLDLDSDYQHRNYWKNLSTNETLNRHHFHKIKPVENSFLTDQLDLSDKETPTVCSSHHQAVNKIGKDFQIAATSLDGKVVEALQHVKYKNVIGTQFHPEFSSLYNPNSTKMKRSPADSAAYTEHEMLVKNNSYQFHLKFWENFSERVRSAKINP